VLAGVACLASWVAHADVRVEISGVDSEVETNIRATLDLVRHGTREDLSEAAVRRLYTRARGQIREAMRPFGYYRPQVEPALERRNGQWRASFRIEPGEPVRLTEVDIQVLGEGSEDPRLLAVIAENPMIVNRRLRHQEYDRLRNSLQSAAAMRGYFDAAFEARRLEVDPAENTARVVLHLQTGPRYRFGPVQTDQDILNEGLFQRIIAVREGEPYDAGTLLETQYRLTDSLYYGTVIVEAGSPDPETLSVPIAIETVPTRRQRIRTGVGYATDTGIRGSLGIDWRRLNPRGHSAGMELRLGENLSEIGGRYRIPIGDPIKERLLFRAGYLQEDLADLESRRATIGASYVTVHGGGWQRTLFTDLLHEQTRTPDEPEQRDVLVVPGIGMEKLVADDILFPRNGYRVRGELRGSHEFLGASTDFLRFETEYNRVMSRGENWRFFARTALGVGLVNDPTTLPASQRFFAGGDQSVRGYSLNSLGPTDDAGNVVGGRYLVFGSLEAERLVWNRFALAAFVDAGNAFDSFEDDVEVSVGLGLNVHTPIGTLRIGVAQSVTESRGVRFHLTIRPDL
jgi:translocation and assembly module TamA